MKPEEQRIAIAEACGWHDWRGLIQAEDKVVAFGHIVPDYLNDLNAIQSAVLSLDKVQRRIYLDMLNDIVPHGNELSQEGCYVHDDDLFNFAHATAAQRCEALLRTMNLWKE